MIVVWGALCGGACAHGRPSPASAPAPIVAAPAADPAAALISQADQHLAAGMAELAQGHLNQARNLFDKAVDTYLSAPGGAYASPRVAEAYRRTLEAIQLRELEALAAGDGFTEASSEPASIDEVVSLAVPEAPTSEEVRKTAEAAVEQEANDLPIDLNDAVLACIELYQGRLRDWFAAALARGGRYLPFIREVFAAEGLPQDLAYVALVESAFKTTALSRAKAKGVWQFIAATGRRYGLQQDWWIDERSHPEKATRAAARYLKELYAMFGDWNLALAGYNAGERKILRAIDRYKTSDFWELARRPKAFRRETRNYVPMIHAAIVVAKAPERYGFEVESETALAYDTAPIEGAVDLRTISECASASLDDVRQLNPELRRLATPAGRTYALRVPPGTRETVLDCVRGLPPERRVRFRTHVVARGESLSAIARRYGSRTRDIAEANGLSLSRRLKPGTDLIIPIDPRARVRTASAARRTPTRSRAASSDLPTEGTVRIRYRIKPGDTLTAIASQYGTTVQELKSWNGLRGSWIAAGDVLTIYTSRKF
jgi:membrane-bound lytic murein transglycosylase D